jgi:hypothetical protein
MTDLATYTVQNLRSVVYCEAYEVRNEAQRRAEALDKKIARMAAKLAVAKREMEELNVTVEMAWTQIRKEQEAA